MPSLPCAWQIAHANASAASADGAAGSASRRITIACTCSLAALPWPTTACLTCNAVYSETGRCARTAAEMAAPRAWPSNSVEWGLTFTNTFSIATSPGWCVSMTLAKSRRMSSRRAGSSPCVLRMQPLATYVSFPPDAMMTPNPVIRSPGSMPRMRRMVNRFAPSATVRRSCALDNRGGVDILNVVDRLERIEQLLHSGGVVTAEIDFGGGLHRHLGEFRLELRLRQGILDRDEIVWRSDDLDRAVVVIDHIVGARFQRRFHQLVLVGSRREDELSAMPEQERDRAVGTQ